MHKMHHFGQMVYKHPFNGLMHISLYHWLILVTDQQFHVKCVIIIV